MYRIKNTFKRVISLTVAFVLVLSLFSSSFSTFAADLSADLTYDSANPGGVDSCDILNDLSSLKLPAEIIGTPQAVNSTGSSVETADITNPANITDYSLIAGSDTAGMHFYNLKSGKTHNDTTLDSIDSYRDGAYTQIVVPFKTPIKLSAIVVANMSSYENWRTGEYEIFASSCLADLFLPESRVHARDNKTEKNQVELYKYKSGKELRYISYIAIRITKPHAVYDLNGSNLSTAIRSRIFEFNAYGTPENANYDVSPDFTVNYNTDSIDLSNTVKALSTSFTYTKGDETKSLFATAGDKMTDYDITTAGEFATAYDVFFDTESGYDYKSKTHEAIGTRHVNGLNKSTGKEQYVTIETELLSKVDIEDILVVNHQSSDLMTGLYEIFAAEKKEDLYKNSIVRFDNTGVKQQIQDIHFDTDKELKNIKFVAMRIYNPITDWFCNESKNRYSAINVGTTIHPRLKEFNVYGKWSNPNFDPDAMTINSNADKIKTEDTITWKEFKYEFTDETGTSKVIMNEPDKAFDYKFDTGNHMTVANNKFFFDLKDGYDGKSRTMDAIKAKYTDGKVRYFTMTLEAETEMNISDFVVVNHPNKALTARDYEIFASDSLSTLFDANSSVVRYLNATGAQIQNIHYAEGKELKNIKFIALRVYDPILSWESSEIKNVVSMLGIENIYPRLMEFNAYGVYSDPNYQPPALKLYDTLDNVDTSKTFQKVLNATFTMNGKSSMVNYTGPDKINDSIITTGSEFPYVGGTKFFDIKDGYTASDKNKAGVGTIYKDGSRYLDLTYTFPTEVRVSDIVVVQNADTSLRLGNYKIYASSKLDTLYTEDNFIGEYDSNKGATQIQDFNWEDGRELTDVKYVGLRLTNAFHNWQDVIDKKVYLLGLSTLFPRIMEFNVYGEYMDPSFVPDVFTDTANFDLSKLTNYGANLVAQTTPSFYSEGKRAAVRPEVPGKVKEKISEAPTNDILHMDLSDPTLMNKEYFDIQWRLQDSSNLDLYRVKGFAYQGMCRDKPEYYATHYQIFVAEEAEDLYKPENMVFEYNAEKMGIMRGMVYEFPANKTPIGAYVALRIIKPSNGATFSVYPRLSLFYVWGEDPKIIPKPTNLAENMPIDAYFSKDKMEEISESNLTAKEVMDMTDSSNSTVAKISTNKTNRKTTEFIYNLCGDMDIDRIALNVLNNSTTGFKTLKVYASDTMAGVSIDDALIWTQSMSGKSGNVNLSKTITTDKKIRYIRFVFEGCKDYLQLNTVNIEGLDNQKNKTRDLAAAINVENIDVIRTDAKTGRAADLTFDEAALTTIFDTAIDTYPVVTHDCVVGEDEFEMTIKLNDLRTINQMNIGFLYGFDEYFADTINVYIAESKDEIEGEFARTKPDYVINKKDAKNNESYKILMRPRLVRYIKFEFRGFSKIEGSQKPGTDEYMLTSIIPEMSFKGTKVTGMQTSDESDTLISFKDNKTGIKAEIVRLDQNDIFTDAVGVKFTPEKATNWQMTSVKKNPFLKVIDKTIYKLEFVDIFGEVVSDLHGRKVRVSFTLPKDVNPQEFMIADASDRTKLSVMETAPINNTVTAGIPWLHESANKVALLQLSDEDDPYWDTIGELEDFTDETDDDLNGDSSEERDEEWYKTIRTEDGRFEVTGIDSEIDTGVKFTATDISGDVSNEFYELIAGISGGKQVAAVYDFSFSLNNEPYIYEGVVDIKMNLPDFIKDYYTDLEVIHLLSETSATMPWSTTIDDELYFQAESFSNFVIIGTAVDPSLVDSIYGDGSLDANDGASPSTGEDGITIPVLMGIVAAAFVILTSTRKKVR